MISRFRRRRSPVSDPRPAGSPIRIAWPILGSLRRRLTGVRYLSRISDLDFFTFAHQGGTLSACNRIASRSKSQEAVAAAQRLASERSNPEVAPPHLLAALLEQDDGVVVPVLQRLGVDPGAARAAADEAIGSLPRLSGNTVPDIRPSKEFVWVAAAGREGGERPLRRVHLHRALPARPRRQEVGRLRPAPRPRRPAQGDLRGPRPAPRHLAQPRGQLRRPREVRPRPDRRGRERQARPGDRPRRGDPPRHPGPLAPHQEQPRPDRRPRRRQDRDRRGPRPADRLRRHPREPARPARDRARHRRAARRLEVPRRVRGAPEGRAEGDPGRRRADRPLHRRAAHDRRRRRRRGRGRRLQPAEADARPRRAALRRRDHPRRVPQAHREGRGARAPLPADLRRRARRRRHDRDPARAQGALRGPPRRPHHRRGDRRRGDPLRSATSPTASCPTRRST